MRSSLRFCRIFGFEGLCLRVLEFRVWGTGEGPSCTAGDSSFRPVNREKSS